MQKIDSFKGSYAFLSNFWPAGVTLDGVEYPSVEHAYQAAKTLDLNERRKFHVLGSLYSLGPASAKRMGRELTLRPDWGAVRLSIMTDLVRQKFTRHRDLAEWLLATGDADLVEGNHWGDTFWGVCKGMGTNHLGSILMLVRDELEVDRVFAKGDSTGE